MVSEPAREGFHRKFGAPAFAILSAASQCKAGKEYEDRMGRSFIGCLVLSVLFGSVFSPQAEAAAGAESSVNSPVGQWKTVDDVTGKPKSVVAIWEENGKLYGRVQKLVDPDPNDPNPTCNDCEGEQKGKPVVGLQILWDLQKDGDGWSGGTILDPANGKTYKCLMSVEDGGTKLKVRGFMGVSLLGRTQYWVRE
jgi:uncharacterized protein (DUF2147 family)